MSLESLVVDSSIGIYSPLARSEKVQTREIYSLLLALM